MSNDHLPTFERLVELLDGPCKDDQRIGSTIIGRHLGVARATAHRLVQTWSANGWLELKNTRPGLPFQITITDRGRHALGSRETGCLSPPTGEERDTRPHSNRTSETRVSRQFSREEKKTKAQTAAQYKARIDREDQEHCDTRRSYQKKFAAERMTGEQSTLTARRLRDRQHARAQEQIQKAIDAGIQFAPDVVARFN